MLVACRLAGLPALEVVIVPLAAPIPDSKYTVD
jgi:hypothetical protein